MLLFCICWYFGWYQRWNWWIDSLNDSTSPISIGNLKPNNTGRYLLTTVVAESQISRCLRVGRYNGRRNLREKPLLFIALLTTFWKLLEQVPENVEKVPISIGWELIFNSRLKPSLFGLVLSLTVYDLTSQFKFEVNIDLLLRRLRLNAFELHLFVSRVMFLGNRDVAALLPVLAHWKRRHVVHWFQVHSSHLHFSLSRLMPVLPHHDT